VAATEIATAAHIHAQHPCSATPSVGEPYEEHIKEIEAVSDEVWDFMKRLEVSFRSLMEGKEY